MVNDLAIRVLSASSRTRIDTFASYASLVRWTIRVEDTFRSATFVRVSYVIPNAGTGTGSILLPAFGICTAGRRETRIYKLLRSWFYIQDYY